MSWFDVLTGKLDHIRAAQKHVAVPIAEAFVVTKRGEPIAVCFSANDVRIQLVDEPKGEMRVFRVPILR